MIIIAVLADIHANEAALRAVAADAATEATKLGAQLTFICLGDIVDYGPDPQWCVEWVRQNCTLVVQGNHDRVVGRQLLQPIDLSVSTAYYPITIWTRMALSNADRRWLAALPEVAHAFPDAAGLSRFTLFHSNLVDLDRGIDNAHTARANLARLTTAYGLFGHTHYAGMFRLRVGNQLDPVEMRLAGQPHEVKSTYVGAIAPNRWHELPHPREQTIFNPGSVGQPRNHLARPVPDRMASYLLLAPDAGKRGRYQFRRVPYDVHQTTKRLRNDVCWRSRHAPARWAQRCRDPQLQNCLRDLPAQLPKLLDLLAAQLDPGGTQISNS
jgi:predicted phosphodiesterase